MTDIDYRYLIHNQHLEYENNDEGMDVTEGVFNTHSWEDKECKCGLQYSNSYKGRIDMYYEFVYEDENEEDCWPYCKYSKAQHEGEVLK